MKTNSFLQPILRAVLANVLGLALATPMAFAGSSSAHIYSHAVDQDTRIAVSLEKPADAVMVNIKLVSTARSEEDRRKEVKAMTASPSSLLSSQKWNFSKARFRNTITESPKSLRVYLVK